MSDETKKDVVEPKPLKFASAVEEAAALDVIYKKALLADLEEQKAERLADKEARAQERETQNEERKYSLADLKSKVADRAIKEQQLKDDREAQGRTFQAQAQTDNNKQSICTHRKGGKVGPRDVRALSTGGNSSQYAIVRHTMITGDLWIRCLRCGKTWLPPIKENYFFEKVTEKDGVFKGIRQLPSSGPQAGKFSPELFQAAVADYNRACQFETNNTGSGSVICSFQKWDVNANDGEGGWIDAKQDVRRSTANTNLR